MAPNPASFSGVVKPVLIGLLGLGISLAIPILIVVVLAVLAQLIINH